MCSTSSGVSSGALKKHSVRRCPVGVFTQTSSLSFLETMTCCIASFLSACCTALTPPLSRTMSPCGESDTVVERREGKHRPVAVQRLCHTAARGLLPVLITQHERYRYEGWYACLGKIPIFHYQFL